ncbi:hypothetical protein [Terasakiella pusilla]|uniref:hypothetical protein n=1 Tax=Terasakiella pusilla TaxID=64973 RepID=UPI003AA9437D
MKARCLAVIWGEKYINEYLSFSFPTLLAEGNLPFLAGKIDLEFVFLTTKESEAAFVRHPNFKRLEKLCKTKFIYIDDLVGGQMYGVILTLAYARGIQDCGASQVDTHFIFMNADFLFSDNSFQTLYNKMKDGEICVLAPSLRVQSDRVLPILSQSYEDTTGRLALTSRNMVGLSLKYLHPTVVGKTINQENWNCKTYNQLYWRVDENTLLARHYLIFMMMIKPTKQIGLINSYCDYGFVPELVPESSLCILDDSDDFFMMELQDFDQEFDYLEYSNNRDTSKKIAALLQEWVTPEHLEVAQTNVVFHSEELPEELQQYKSEADRVVRDIQSHCGQPLSHVNHPYWLGGVESWLKTRRKTDQFDYQHTIASYERLQSKRRHALKKFLFGQRPYVPIWHWDWSSFKTLRKWLRSSKGRNYILTDNPSYIFDEICAKTDFIGYEHEQFLDDVRLIEEADNILLFDCSEKYVEKVMEHVKKCSKPCRIASILLFSNHMTVIERRARLYQHSISFNRVKSDVQASFAGGYLDFVLAEWQMENLDRFATADAEDKWLRFPLVFVKACFYSALLVVKNVLSMMATHKLPKMCSSVFLSKVISVQKKPINRG